MVPDIKQISDKLFSLDSVVRQRVELIFTRRFWLNVLFIAVLAASLSWWVVYVYASVATTAVG
jgi:hypothetical protein